MVQLQDLRKDCYVILKTDKNGIVNEKVCYVCAIDEDNSVTVRSITDETKYTCKTNHLKGIRLTKELIQSIGFEKEKDGDYSFLIKTDDFLDISIVYSDKKFTFKISYFHDPDDLLGQTLGYEMENLKFLHQLQNIYRDFTNKDMDIIQYLEKS